MTMDGLSQILAGLKAAWWLLWSVPAVPMAEDASEQAIQLLLGTGAVLAISVVMLATNP